MDPRHLEQLVGDLEADLDRYEALGVEIEGARARLIDREPESYDLRAVATIIHDVYRGAEGMLVRIAKVIDEELPNDEHWHQQLLEQLSQALVDVRGPVLRQATKRELDRYRAFRHVQRNIYGFELLWPQMQPLFDAASDVMSIVRDDIRDFIAFLEVYIDAAETKP